MGQKVFAPLANPAAIPSHPNADRRAFLKGMGIAGLASVLAFGKSMQALANTTTANEAPPSTVSTASTTSTTTNASVPSLNLSASASTTCVLRCNRRCAYPGKCRRYVDSNANGRCDLGECFS